MSRLTASAMARAQGLFYVASGLWPIAHLPSFEVVTGPKVDGWLVKTVGGLIAVAGGVMWSAGRRERVTPEIEALAVGSAAALTAIDVVYVAKGRIPRVYLLDAVVEAGLIAGWLWARRRSAAHQGFTQDASARTDHPEAKAV